MTPHYPPPSVWALIVVAASAAGAAAAISVAYVGDRTETARVATMMTGGDPSRAPPLFRRYGCAGCHAIPGIDGADGRVGANLSGLRQRVYIAGVVNNSGENLVGWIVSPRRFSPKTAMPETGISERDARDIAAYLYAH